MNGEMASFGRRLGGFLLDRLIYGLLGVVLMVPGVALIASQMNDCPSSEPDCLLDDQSAALLFGGVALVALGVVAAFVLYVRALGSTGQTFGRKIVGVRVVDAQSGTSIGVGRAVVRTLFAWLISSMLIFLGYFWMIWDENRQTWHDKVAGTSVLKGRA